MRESLVPRLKLEVRKVPLEMIVIDHAEKPTAD
jgi:uncharacterized protein (TIGR03435 family)